MTSYDHVNSGPTCIICNAFEQADTSSWIYQDDTWVVRPTEPNPIPGWMQLATRRHTSDLSALDDHEAATLGPVMRRIQQALITASGALRVYTASLCEATPHFHVSLIPRMADMPAGATGFEVFDLLGRVRRNELPTADADVTATVLSTTRRLLAD
jgi:diadenosine tetraphosphate (Ap4A) HIT family hydrolase